MRTRVFLKAFLVLGAAANALWASAITTGTATLTGVNGAAVGGYYTSPYYMTFNGNPVEVFCDDFADNIAMGQTWQASVFSGSDLTGTYFALSDSNYIQDYDTMFWLTDQSEKGIVDQVLAQEAIWSVEDSSYQAEPAALALLSQAQAQGSTVNPASFLVIYGVNASDPDRPQEFIAEAGLQSMSDSTADPEPGTVSLCGLGALFVAVGLRRKKAVN